MTFHHLFLPVVEMLVPGVPDFEGGDGGLAAQVDDELKVVDAAGGDHVVERRLALLVGERFNRGSVSEGVVAGYDGGSGIAGRCYSKITMSQSNDKIILN